MTTLRTNVLSLLFISIIIAVAAYLYPSLPDQIPTHWNIRGEVDDYTPKPWGVIVLPLAAILIFVIMKLIPIVSPKGFRTDQFMDVINIFTVTLVGFMSGIGLLVLLAASGRNIQMNEMVFAALGILFIVLGNYMSKVRKNFFIGIRTPWTLASDEVWARTHRMGGWIFVLIGFFMFLNAFVQFPQAWLIGSIIVLALVPIVYSFVLYKNLEGFEEETTGTD